MQLVAWGSLFYAFAVLLPHMQQDLGWSHATLASGYSGALLLSGLLAPRVGVFIDRGFGRRVVTGGALAGVAGLVLWSVATHPAVYAAAWLLVGIAMAGTFYAPVFAVVVRLDPTRSRRAILAITLVGALASTVFLPLTAWLSASLGWRGSLVVLATGFAVVVLPTALTLPSPRHEPSSMATPPCSARPWALRLLTASLTLASVASVAFSTHVVMLLASEGRSVQAAATIAGLGGIAKLGGRLLVALATRVPPLVLMRLCLVLVAVALPLPLLSPSNAACVLMVLLVGAANGARTIVRPALVVELVGARRFGRHDGTIELFTTSAKSLGPLGLGVLLGAVGRDGTWTALVAVMSAAALLLFAIPSKPR